MMLSMKAGYVRYMDLGTNYECDAEFNLMNAVT